MLSSFLRNLGQAADVEMLRSEVRDVRASSPVEMPVWEAVLRGWARLREPRLVALATSARQGSKHVDAQCLSAGLPADPRARIAVRRRPTREMLDPTAAMRSRSGEPARGPHPNHSWPALMWSSC